MAGASWRLQQYTQDGARVGTHSGHIEGLCGAALVAIENRGFEKRSSMAGAKWRLQQYTQDSGHVGAHSRHIEGLCEELLRGQIIDTDSRTDGV